MATNSCHENTIDMVKHEWHVDTVSLNILKTAHLHVHLYTATHYNNCHGLQLHKRLPWLQIYKRLPWLRTYERLPQLHTHTIPLPASVVPLLALQLLSQLGSVSQYQ